VIEILKLRYLDLRKQNLPIFGISKPNLRDYTTTEKDMKRGQSRMPSPSLRMKDEDLLKDIASPT
jgi:hypothetical protein